MEEDGLGMIIDYFLEPLQSDSEVVVTHRIDDWNTNTTDTAVTGPTNLLDRSNEEGTDGALILQFVFLVWNSRTFCVSNK